MAPAKYQEIADRLRDQILGLGWSVTDGPSGFSLAQVVPAEGAPDYLVLPDPGGPIIKTLCAPAAATSSALFAVVCPRTSRKSSVAPSVAEG